MQQARKLPNPSVKLFYNCIPISESKSNRRISKGLISESKFRFETAGSIRLTLIKMHLIKSKECNRRANYPIPRLNCTTLYGCIPISESKFRLFRFETAGSIRLTLIYKMHSIADSTRLTLINMHSI